MSSEFDDFETLILFHFLIGRPITSVPVPQLLDVNEKKLSKWQKVVKLSQRIWTVWKRDCSNNLKERSKWKFFKKNDV